jgi:DNA topoisomerase-1
MPPFKRYIKKNYANKSFTKQVDDNAEFLIIVESPSKCAKIEKFLGDKYCCIASKGHLRTIAGLSSIDIKNETFQPTFSSLEDKKDHIEHMRTIITKFTKENIILATDDDREGEAIAWHICEIFGLSITTTHRIKFHEITKNAVINAVTTPTKLNMDLIHAQHARQVLDIIVGFTISPFLWKYLYHDKSNSLSAGRCQTPALRLVYDNDMKNDGKREVSYKTTGIFTTKNLAFELQKNFEQYDEVLDFLEESKDFQHILSIGSPKDTKRSAPQPFNTSRLLQHTSNVMHMSPKETMSLCQRLYQEGHITYMRTDSKQYSKQFLEEASKYIMKEWKNEKFLGDLEVLENKENSNPHEAIRVTNINLRHLEKTEESIRLVTLYNLIWLNTVESCMADAKMKITNVNITAPCENMYVYVHEIPVFLGWLVVKEKSNNDLVDKQNELGSLLFWLKTINPIIPYNRIDSTITIKTKDHHYTESSLIKKLETLGIGRPSTYATLIDTIQERGYVKRTDIEGMKQICREPSLEKNTITTIEKERIFGNEKQKLILQPLGKIVIEFLIEHFQELFSYNYTRTMEEKLDIIGTVDEWSDICKTCYNEIKDLSKPLSKLEKHAYAIDATHDFLFEKFGPVIRAKKEDGTIHYISVKKDIRIDLEKLENGGYKLDELVELNNIFMGFYEGEELFIKNGQYGSYVQWGEHTKSLGKTKRQIDTFTLEEIIAIITENDTCENKTNNVLRELTPFMSVRRGKFGAYIYYKRPDMQRPEFYNMKKFPHGFSTCEARTLIDWVKNTYKIEIE